MLHAPVPERGGAERQRDVERLADLEARERRRRHADDGDRPIEHGERTSDRVVAAAERRLPEPVADHGRRAASTAIVAGSEQPSTRGNDAERAEEVAADPQAARPSRFRAAPDDELGVAPREHRRERALVRANQFPQGSGRFRVDAVVAAERLRPIGPDLGQLLRTRDGEAAQLDGVDEVKDRGVRADAERERENRDDGEDRTALQQPQPVSRVAESMVDEARVHAAAPSFVGVTIRRDRSRRSHRKSFPNCSEFIPESGAPLRLRFRDLLFDVGTRSLTRGDRPVPLSPKAFRLLEVLVMRRPDAVSHEELRRTLWSDAANGGTTLARLVSEIRTALDDHDDEQPIVRTVHRFGYAFAEATAVEDERATLPVGRYAIRWGSQLVPLADGENFVGRALDGVIAVPSSKASRRHARIVVSPEKAVIEDLGSRNGTRVNDALIDGPVELKNGDRIRVGPAVLVFCVAGSSGVTSEETGPVLDSGG